MAKIYRYMSIYIYIYINFGGGGVHRTCFVKYSKKRKKYKRMTYTKIKLYIILIYIFFPRINNKKIKKNGPPKNFKNGAARRRFNYAKMSRVVSYDTPHTVWTIFLPLRKEGTLCQNELTKIYQHLHFNTSNIHS